MAAHTSTGVNLLHIVIYFVRPPVIVQKSGANHGDRHPTSNKDTCWIPDHTFFILQEFDLFFHRNRFIFLRIFNKFFQRISQPDFGIFEGVGIKQSPYSPCIPVGGQSLSSGINVLSVSRHGIDCDPNSTILGGIIRSSTSVSPSRAAANHNIHDSFL